MCVGAVGALQGGLSWGCQWNEAAKQHECAARAWEKILTRVPSGSIPTRPLRRRGHAQKAKHGCMCDCKPPAHTSAMSKCNSR